MADKQYLLGMDCVLTVGSEICSVKDVTLNLTTATADVTTRCNNGWRATAPTLKECTVDFDYIPDESGSPGVFGAAFLNGTVLSVTVAAGGAVFAGDFTVTSLTRGEPLEDAVTYSVSLSLVEYTPPAAGGE